MEKIDRRSVLQCCASVAIAGAGVSGTTKAINENATDDFYEAQARFVIKYVGNIKESFNVYRKIFNPPTNPEIVDLFVDSVTPSLSSMIPYLGNAIELKETLDWYDSVGENSRFRLISDFGVTTDGVGNYRGGGGEGMNAASEEIQDIVDQCDNIRQQAENCVQNPSREATNDIVVGMEDLIDSLTTMEWVERWANIDTSAYENVARGLAEITETAEKIANNAESVLEIASRIRADVKNKKEIMAAGEFISLPAAVVKFNKNVSSIRSQAPGVVFNQVAGDSFHIITQDDSGEELTVRWINTDSDGKIQEFEVSEQDSANADFQMSEDTRDSIINSEEPIKTAQNAYTNGNVKLNANGFLNQLKYGSGKLIADLFL